MSSFKYYSIPSANGHKASRFHRKWAALLPLKGARGVPAIEGADAPYEDWLCQYFYPLLNPNKKRTSHMRGSLTFPEFAPPNPSFPYLAQ